MSTANPFAHPIYLLAKPVGAVCNLRCKYCYYLEKGKLYEKERQTMNDATLEQFVKSYIEAQTTPEVLFVWHGGEPLVRSMNFYKKALQLQQKYAKGRRISNCLQTNGTLITEEWCKFFRENGFLIGISIDGPQEYHDHYRRTPQGKSTFAQVLRGIELLNRYGVEWNGMAVVNDRNVHHPIAFYRFFKSIGCRYLQFTPIVERNTQRTDGLRLAPGMNADGVLTKMSVKPEEWGNFLIKIFDEWVRHDVGQMFVQLFDATLSNWVGVPPGLCTMAEECGYAGCIEHNGDVYACDHFVFPEYKLGNIHHQSLTEMLLSKRQQDFAKMKRIQLPQQCVECRFRFACHGECPKNRFVKDRYGNDNLNYLCAGYYRFFDHVAPYMEKMKAELEAGRPPANIMHMI